MHQKLPVGRGLCPDTVWNHSAISALPHFIAGSGRGPPGQRRDTKGKEKERGKGKGRKSKKRTKRNKVPYPVAAPAQ